MKLRLPIHPAPLLVSPVVIIMDEELAYFLDSGTFLCEDTISWGNGTMPLKVTCYLGDAQPPLSLVSSVRAIVFKNDHVLVVSQKNGEVYILPGGRVEKGELPVDTLKREVLEETGWTLQNPKLLGCQHLHHLGPRPEGYAYPYPDFIWPIYSAEAKDFVPKAITPDDWVSESHFRPVEEVRKLALTSGELLFLEAALKRQLRRGAG